MNDKRLETIQKASDKSIIDVLTSMGIEGRWRHGAYICSSPYTEDRRPSFWVYPNNKYKDYSTGEWGDVVDLVSKLQNVSLYEAAESLLDEQIIDFYDYDAAPKTKKEYKFVIERYRIDSWRNNDRDKIYDYMNSRKIRDFDIMPCQYFTEINGTWDRNIGLGFIHRDEMLNACGIKIRNLSGEDRYTSRGRLNMHVIEWVNFKEEPTMILCESETSGNAIASQLIKLGKKNFVILCFGGLDAKFKIPHKYEYLTDRYLYVDHDNNDEAWVNRYESFNRLYRGPSGNLLPLLIEGYEDPNDLLVSGKLDNYNYLFDLIN